MPTVTTDLESRVAALESQVAELSDRLEQAQTIAAVQRGLEQLARGQGIPAREAVETLRKKYNIPARNLS